MKSKYRFIASVFIVLSTVLFNCKGEEGEVGPKGDTGTAGPTGAQGPAGPQGPVGQNAAQLLEDGFIKGILKGTRRDGTAFKETFEYKLADGKYGFTKRGPNLDELYISRIEDLAYNGWADMNLLIENKGQANQIIRLGRTYLDNYSDTGFDIEFNKVLPDRTLFKLEVEALFEADEISLPMSRANNATYKLVNYGIDYHGIYDDSGEYYVIFNDEAGNRIYFVSTGSEYEFSHIINSSGQKITTSSLFENVIVSGFYSTGNHVFSTKEGEDLYEILEVPADTFEITNFNHNTTTGELTYDYKVVIQPFRKENSTRHSLEISGSVKATVYNGVVMRQSFE